MGNQFDNLFTSNEQPEAQADTPNPQAKAKTKKSAPAKKKRGRPATGKRSDDDWISRAFYIEESTDIDLEGELIQLRREGVRMDKSELVNSCLLAWLKWRKGEQPSKCLSEISPRRKDE